MLDAFLQPKNLIMLGTVLGLLCFSGFFSGSETALTAASRARMHAAEKDGDKRASIVSKLLNMRERLLGGILLGNNMVNILASVIRVDVNLPAEQIVKEVLDSGHSRIPVYEEDQDNIIGILHVKDILKSISKANGDFTAINAKKIMRDAWFVPETTSVVKQLRAFQHKREHFALVVDEYGALMGVLTLEDILEEIVGDIQDVCLLRISF